MKKEKFEEKWSRLFAAKRYHKKPVTLSVEEQIEILEDFKNSAREKAFEILNSSTTFDILILKVKSWAAEKSLLKIENAPKQIMKVNEEFGELCSAILRGYSKETKDGFGDVFITIIILCFQLDLDPTECLEFAWNEIKNRTGKTVNGNFIKD